MRSRYTPRDRRLLRFIEAFGVVQTRQLHQLFFEDVTMRTCQRRLSRLVEAGALKRRMCHVCPDYVYHIEKVSQIEHSLKRVEAYIELSQMYRLSEFDPRFKIGKIRPDAYVEIWNGKPYPFFLEIQRSVGFDQLKYNSLYASQIWREQWREFPPVVVLSGRPIRLLRSSVKFIILDLQQPAWGNLQKEIGAQPAQTETPKSERPMSAVPKGSFLV